MAGRHYNWHKAWVREDSRHLLHQSGLRVLISRGEDYTDFECDPTTLQAYQAFEFRRGVPLHDVMTRLKRLLAEARMWRDPTPN